MRKILLTLAAAVVPMVAESQSPPPLAAADTAGRQIVLITGSTDGLGREVAMRVAATGAHVIVHGRNAERGNAVVSEIMRGGKGTARFYGADLASLDAVRKLAQSVLRDYGRLNVLVNNAGLGSASASGREVSRDGHELRFAVNYLSGFLLTRMLLPRLVSSAPSRIVNVASLAQTPIDFNDPMIEKGWTGGRAYGQSKLAQIMFTFDLAKELEGKRVIATALHPATYMATEMVRKAGVEPRSTVAEGAEAVMQLITGDVQSGQYFNGKNPARANAQAYDEVAREKLRTLSKLLTGTM